MSTEHLRVQVVKVGDLHRFACAFFANAEDQELSPITKHRALAQSRNPYADREDPGLLLVRHGEKYVGYLGLMPGRMWTGKELRKVLWCTTLYILPAYRGGLAASLLADELNSVANDLAASGPSASGRRFFLRSGFHEVRKLPYHTVAISSLDLTAWPWAGLRRLFRKSPNTQNRIDEGRERLRAATYCHVRQRLLERLAREADDRLGPYSLQEVSSVESFAQQFSDEACFVRGSRVINWMLRYPWVCADERAACPTYYFSDVREAFRYRALEVQRSDGSNAGFVVMSVSRDRGVCTLRLCDHRLADDVDRAMAFAICCRLAKLEGADRITLLPELDPSVSFPGLGSLVKRRRLTFVYRAKPGDGGRSDWLRRLRCEVADGDMAFT